VKQQAAQQLKLSDRRRGRASAEASDVVTANDHKNESAAGFAAGMVRRRVSELSLM